MTPALKNRIMRAQRKLSEAEQRVAPLFGSLTQALNTELAARHMSTLHNLIFMHVAGGVPKESLTVFAEFVADELNVSIEAVEALTNFKIATFEFGLALSEGYASQPGNDAHG